MANSFLDDVLGLKDLASNLGSFVARRHRLRIKGTGITLVDNPVTEETELDLTGFASTPGAHAESHQNGGPDEINVGGLSGKLADNQRAGELATSGAAVVVSAASPPSTGQVLTATGATAASWQTPTSIVSADSEFWATPASPHANNVEFNASSSIPAGWAYANGTDGTTPTIVGTPDILTALSTTDQIKVDYNVRRSWWRAQAPKDGKRYCFYRSLPVGTDYTIRGRVRAQTLEQVNGSRIGIFIASDNGGRPDLRTGSSGTGVGYIFAGWQSGTTSGAEIPSKIQRVNGSNADVFKTIAGANLLPYMDCEFVIVRSGNNYNVNLLHNGYTAPIDAGTATLTVAWYGFWFEAASGGSLVARISGGDYARYEATANPVM